MKRLTTSILILIGIFPSIAFSDYFAVGPFKGWVCKGFGIELCNYQKLDAVKKGGQFYDIKKSWDKVDEYKPGSGSSPGLCVLRVNEGAFSYLAGKQEFYRYNASRELEYVDVDGHIQFSCRRR
ncbi:MAG: hypothetical protein LM513_02745 [Nitrospira sp.]|nr:hypothetical protein [Nitrospira sp.]